MDILQTTDLKKYYGKGDTMVKALDGVSLCVEQGSFVSVVGTSGSGKSTLLHMLGGLDRPTEGTVTVDGRDISRLKDEELTIFRRRKIGFVFQSYNLVPVLNVYENIVLPVELDGNQPDQGICGGDRKSPGISRKEIQPPLPVIRRPTTAGSHRPRPCRQTRDLTGRRTHRQSGLRYQPGCIEPVEGDQRPF